jgi:hypothetical protein
MVSTGRVSKFPAFTAAMDPATVVAENVIGNVIGNVRPPLADGRAVVPVDSVVL